MTFSLNQYTFISEFIETAATKSYQLLAFLNKVLTSFVVLIMLFLSLFAIIGMASHTQKLEADVGLRHKNVSIGQVSLINKIQNAILNPVKANAFSLNPLDGLGEILGSAMKAVAEPIFNIILNLIKNIVLPIFDAILKPILSVLNGILDTINGLLSVVDSLGANLSAARVGMGFRVYKDIEGTGQGTSNFESSGNFTKRLLQVSNTSTSNQTIFSSSYTRKDEARNLLADSIAWSDFMTVQKALQFNVLGSGDITTAALQSVLVNFDTINRNITDIVIGTKCEGSDVIFAKTPVFKSFGAMANTCTAENRGIVTQQLTIRQEQITQAALAKSQQYNTNLPSDCKFGQYFEMADGINLDYSVESPGDLGGKIATFASGLTIKNITAQECYALVTGKQSQTNVISQLLSPSNIVAGLISGASISVLLSDIFTKSSKELFASINAKFNKAMTIIKSIANFSAVKSGVGLVGALSTVIGLREQINSKLDGLNKDYESYRTNQQYQALDTSETTLREINQIS